MELFLDHLSDDEKLLVKIGNKLPGRLFSGFIDFLKFKDDVYWIFKYRSDSFSFKKYSFFIQNKDNNFCSIFDIEEKDIKKLFKSRVLKAQTKEYYSKIESLFPSLYLSFIFDCLVEYINWKDSDPLKYHLFLNEREEQDLFKRLKEEMKKTDYFDLIDKKIIEEKKNNTECNLNFKRNYSSFIDALVENKNIRDLLLIYKNFYFSEDKWEGTTTFSIERSRDFFVKEIIKILET